MQCTDSLQQAGSGNLSHQQSHCSTSIWQALQKRDRHLPKQTTAVYVSVAVQVTGLVLEVYPLLHAMMQVDGASQLAAPHPNSPEL